MMLEGMIASTIMEYLGNPMFVGLLVVMFFVTWAVVMRLRLEAALSGLVPAFIMASAFIPGLQLVAALGGGILLGLILMRIGVR